MRKRGHSTFREMEHGWYAACSGSRNVECPRFRGRDGLMEILRSGYWRTTAIAVVLAWMALPGTRTNAQLATPTIGLNRILAVYDGAAIVRGIATLPATPTP